VCLTQTGVHELAGDRWARVGDAPADLPGAVEGQRGRSSNGAGAVWDPVRAELVFWLHDHDETALRLFAWNGGQWRRPAITGLPEELLSSFGDQGVAIGEHPEHGVVIYAGPEHGLFGRTDDGWRSLGAGGPPRSKGSQLAYDAARGALVLSPFANDEGDQNVFHELRDGRWRRLGTSVEKSLLDGFSGGTTTFARHHGVTHVVNGCLATAVWNPSGEGGFWRPRYDADANDGVRGGNRMQAVVTAWDGALHALLGNGAVLELGEQWLPRVKAPPTWKDPSFPLVAFDPLRKQLVAWGPLNKKGVRKPETYVHDRISWTKAKVKDKPQDDDDLAKASLYFDSARGMVARLGKVERAYFDGARWEGSILRGAEHLETWKRCVCHDPASGITVVVNLGEKTVVRIDGDTVVPVATFKAPAGRDRDENLPFDQWWFDAAALALVVHDEADDRRTFAYDLRPAFTR
jgi:hypothetical protein